MCLASAHLKENSCARQRQQAPAAAAFLKWRDGRTKAQWSLKRPGSCLRVVQTRHSEDLLCQVSEGVCGEVYTQAEVSMGCMCFTNQLFTVTSNGFIAPRNDSGGVLVFECKWVTMERERNGLLWSESVMGYYGACMMGYYGRMVYGSYDHVPILGAM